MTALDKLEKRLDGPGLIVALAKDEARDLLSAALASDHIGNSTTMVPTLGVEGVARIIFDATYDARHGSTSEMEAFWSRCDSAARAIISPTIGAEGVARIIRQHVKGATTISPRGHLLPGLGVEGAEAAARAIIAAMGKQDGATLGVAQIKATIWKHWRNQNGQTLEDRFTAAAEEIADLTPRT
jgi:hypothetical protein